MMQKHTEKMKRLFKAADMSGDGLISLNEFQEIMELPSVRMWLAAQDISVPDTNAFFRMLAKGDDTISAVELVTGVAQLKGPAKATELRQLQDDHKKVLDIVE